MVKANYKICIICEGEEEVDYLSRLKELGVWSKLYSVKLKNASSLNNIVSIYQNTYFSDYFDLVLVFCDTEVEPYTQYKKIRENLTKLFGSEKAVDYVLFYANPCSMQIILSHFGKVTLTSNAKYKNERDIEKLTGVKEYRATQKQRLAIMKKINVDNYITLKDNLSKLGTKDVVVGSTNFLTLLKHLESDNSKWIKHINDELDKD